jgi:hypothetical protein
LCPDCYDYAAAVVWNAHSGELWRRTIITLRRQLDKAAKAHGARVRLSYAKVAESQRRGLINFHAIFRLGGTDPANPERTVQPHPAITADALAGLIRQAVTHVWFATIPHPVKPNGWDIRSGAHATTLLLAGVPVHVVSARLGHADPSVTLRVYSHVLRGHAQGVGDVFAQAIKTSVSKSVSNGRDEN